MKLCKACKYCNLGRHECLSMCANECSIPWDYLKAIELYNNDSITMDELMDKLRHIAATYFN